MEIGPEKEIVHVEEPDPSQGDGPPERKPAPRREEQESDREPVPAE